MCLKTFKCDAGLNMNCGVFLANYTARAVSQGKVDESRIDESLSYLYSVLMRLGSVDKRLTLQHCSWKIAHELVP